MKSHDRSGQDAPDHLPDCLDEQLGPPAGRILLGDGNREGRLSFRGRIALASAQDEADTVDKMSGFAPERATR